MMFTHHTSTDAIARLAAQGRARVVRNDGRAVVVRLDPPAGGHAVWPANVVVLRRLGVTEARGISGLAR